MDILVDLVRWLIALPAAFLFLWCSIANWWLLFKNVICRGRASLILPFVGPLLGMVAIVAVPIDGLANYWWTAALIEPTWLLGVWCLVELL